MKKHALLICFIISSTVFSQVNFEKMQREYDSLRDATTYGNNKSAGRYYDINGFKMYCEVYGSGEPLLFIHGNGGSIKDFVKQIPYFSKKYKVIVADSRAQGKSLDKGQALTYEMMADDYAELLTKIGIDSVNVVGWSDGGINALLLTMRHPNKVKKLIVTGANLRPDTTAVEPDVIAIVQKPYSMLKEKKDKNEEENTVFKYLKLLLEQPNIPVESLHQIKIPALIIGGDHDVIRPKHTLEIFENIEKSNLWLLPNSGHSTLVVYTDEFNKKLEEFLKSPYRTIEKRTRFF